MLALRDPAGAKGALEELRSRALAIAHGDDRRSAYLRDLVVYEGYHEHLAEAAGVALDGRSELSDAERRDPDVSFVAYLAWCARQPATPAAHTRGASSGPLSISEGLRC